jgi:hypothetical protein
MDVRLTISVALTGKIKLVDLAGSENNKVFIFVSLHHIY